MTGSEVPVIALLGVAFLLAGGGLRLLVPRAQPDGGAIVDASGPKSSA